MKLIVAATDGSEGAERAVGVAADLVKSPNGKLLIVNVSENGFTSAQFRELDRLRVTEGDALDELSHRILMRAKALAQARGAVNIETMSAAGDPAELLIQIANDQHADALVVGRRGRGPLERLILGSVSQKLSTLRRASW